MLASNPVFSIVMATFNSERYVKEAVDSVIGQAFESWELLIVDDASNDQTPQLLKHFEEMDSRIKVFYMRSNEGPARARNLAIAQASGRLIAFLDSDDVWRRDKLGRQFDIFRATSTPLTYSAYEKINEDGERIGRIVTIPASISYSELLGATVIATCTAVYDTSRVGKVFMPDIRKRQDFGLWLRILRPGGQAIGINEPLAYLRKRSGSVSSNKVSAAVYVWRVYRELEGLSILKSAYYFSKYAYHASIKASI